MPSLQLIKITAETSKNSKFNFLANSWPSVISTYLIFFKSDLVPIKTPYNPLPSYFFIRSYQKLTLLNDSLLEISKNIIHNSLPLNFIL